MLKIVIITLIVIVAAGWSFSLYGKQSWRHASSELEEHIATLRVPFDSPLIEFPAPGMVPPVVTRYLQLVLREGDPMISSVRFYHRGTFNMSDSSEQWKTFTSEQWVVTQRPGFYWNGKINIFPGVRAYVHDAYVGGRGILHAAIFGLITVADIQGEQEIAEGELMRFLAESAWYPTALLPGKKLVWEENSESSARATLTDGPLSASLTFHFNNEGFIESVKADSRARASGSDFIPTPWQGRFWNYQERGGFLIPHDGEVAWLYPDGARPYWRGTIEHIEYEFAK